MEIANHFSIRIDVRWDVPDEVEQPLFVVHGGGEYIYIQADHRVRWSTYTAEEFLLADKRRLGKKVNAVARMGLLARPDSADGRLFMRKATHKKKKIKGSLVASTSNLSMNEYGWSCFYWSLFGLGRCFQICSYL